jgi:hypothetical protein
MKKLNITKEKVIIFFLSVLFTFFVSNNIFHVRDVITISAPVLIWAALFTIFCFLMFQAGLIVIKSLALVAAELSLIIFLAQSYCAPEVMKTPSGNSALAGLVLLGLSYVMYRFFFDVYAELQQQGKKFKEVDGKWSFEAIALFIMLVLFVILFTVMIFEVVSPIVRSFCIYK